MRNLAVVPLLIILVCCPALLLAQGSLWGVTAKGGISSAGVIFQYDLATRTYTKKHDFNGTSDGYGPKGGLCLARNGKLYGVTSYRGAHDKGVIFEYDISTGTFTKKLDFDGLNGDGPIAGLTLAPNGKLYGMSRVGGANGLGTLFEYDPDLNSLLTKIDFKKVLGYYPRGALTLASNGKLYGTTQTGGSLTVDMGTLFEYDPLTNIHTTLHRFEGGIDGSFPWASVTEGIDGKLYGTMPNGGAGDVGYVFSYDISTNEFKSLHDFPGWPNGANPYDGRFSRVLTGKLYGLTDSGPGGQAGPGVLYSYDPGTDVYTKEYTFNSSQTITGGVIDMFSGLVQVNDTKLYGMTMYGGSIFYYGTLFEYDLVKKKYETLVHFDQADGATPDKSPLLFLPGIAQTITFNELPVKKIFDPSFTLSATASSTLPVRFASSNPSVATISGSNVVTIVGSGTTMITAYQDGDSQYTAATPVQRELVVTQASQEIIFPALPGRMTTNPPFDLTATSSSGLQVAYTSSNPAVATVTNGRLTIVGAGTTTITAYQEGNNQYAAAQPVERLFVVTKASQTITFEMLPEKLTSDPPFELTATASSGLPVVYSSDNPNVAAINGTTLSIKGAGSAIITAMQPGNDTYESAPQKSSVLVVNLVTATSGEFATLFTQVYPNPVSRVLKIQLGNVNPEDLVTISIMDSQGRTVMNSSYPSDDGEVNLVVEQLPVGTYFVRCSNTINTWQLRFVKE